MKKVVLAYLDESDVTSIYVDGKLCVKDTDSLFGSDTEHVFSLLKRRGILEYEERVLSDVVNPPSELPEKQADEK